MNRSRNKPGEIKKHLGIRSLSSKHQEGETLQSKKRYRMEKNIRKNIQGEWGSWLTDFYYINVLLIDSWELKRKRKTFEILR